MKNNQEKIKSIVSTIGILTQIFTGVSSGIIAFGLFLLSILGIVYIICPVDLIPDVIPFLGWADDFIAGILSIISGILSIVSMAVATGIMSIGNKTEPDALDDDEIKVENKSK